MMKIRGAFVIAVIIGLSFAGQLLAQISEGGQPLSFSKQLPQNIQTINMPSVDVAAFLAEDEIEESKGVPYRFGAPFEVNYDLNNSGSWEELPNGDRVWRLKIVSTGAYSINLIYDRFFLPSGGTFYVYNEDHSMKIGAFTERNNKEHGQFATALVKGDVSVLEYYEPKNVRGKGIISIKRIVHAYRNLFNWDLAKQMFDYGGSGSCNNNVACPVGDGWRDDIRAAAMITTSGGFRLCSGSMVNNVREDLTPYFLTANHCLGGEPTWVFMFNYESPSCSNVDGPTWMTVSGSTLRATATFSDFALLELSSPPPDSYNVYYAGWSAVDTAADSCVAIHHPSGDIKKISFNYNALSSTSYLGTTAGDGSHWRIDNWEDGTTEPGSSGSPIFDYNHHLLGQLHGGYASCASITSDWYGKFAISWANGGSVSSRLKDWLDPDNTGALELGGRDGAGIKITHTPLLDTRDSLNDYQVLATIKSNVPLTPDSLLLYYQISSVWYEDTLTATANPDEFEGFIPAQTPGTAVNYYLFARDSGGNADTTAIYSFRVIDFGAALVPSYSEKTVASGDTAWHTFVVTNTGIYNDDFDLSVSGNLWASSIWDETGTIPISSTGLMASDDTLVFKIMVEVPPTLFGEYDSSKVGVTSTGDPTVSLGAGVKTISAGEPFAIPFTDNFPITTVNPGKWVIIEDATVNSGGLNPPSAPYSLNFNGSPDGSDLVSSQAINLKNESNVILSYYYEQTGAGDSPETNDDLLVEYLDSLGNWNMVTQHAGAGPDMTDFVKVETALPGNAYHSNFRIRFSNTATAGNFDDWYVDDVYVGLPQDYDVAFSPSFASNNGPSADTTSYLLRVKNKGIFDDNYDLSDSNAVWSVSFYDGTGITPISSTGTILAGDSLDIVVKVAIPSGSMINDADTADVYAVSQANPVTVGTAVLVTVSAGTPTAYPWFEPFPDPTLSTVRWFYNSGAVVSVNGAVPPSSPYSLNLDGGIDTAVSQLIDLSAKSGVVLSYYYQRGGGGEAPDAGDDLWVEYVNNVGSWITLNTHLGSGAVMSAFEQVSLGLPADAFHSGFQLRLRSFGTGAGFDDWYVDDIRVDYAPAIAVSPASMFATLPLVDSTTRDLIISNAGPGGLNYSVNIQPQAKRNGLFQELLAAGNTEPAQRKYADGFSDYNDPKGVDDPRSGFPVEKNAGGPDAFGYFWIDSDEPGGPVFSWLDVSGTGTDIVADLTDDNFGGPYSIGMSFSYYGNTYNQIYIGSNGIIGFGATDMDSRFKANIPTATTPNDIIAWLWDDLNPLDVDNPGVHVYVDFDGSRCVIQFVDYPEYAAAAGDVVTAEVILYLDGTIVMQYQTIAAGFDVANCAVGIENVDGTDGLEVAYLTPYLHDSLAIKVFAAQQWLAVDQSSGALLAGEADTLICSINSSGLDIGVYNSNIVINSNDPDPAENPWTVPVQLTVSNAPPFICGDIDNDSDGPNVADLTYLVAFLFLGGPPPPVLASADMDAGGDINVADLTVLVAFLFSGGNPLVCP